MTLRHFLSTAAAVLALAAALSAFGQNQDREKDKDKDRDRDRQKQQDRDQQNVRDQDFARLWHIVGASVKTQDGKNIGKIENLAIDPRTGQVVYAIVDVRGVSELSNKSNLAIPIRALRFTGEKQAQVNVDMQRLNDAPPFNPSGWDTIGNIEWGRKVHEFYRVDMNLVARDDRDRAQDRDQVTLVKATDLKDARIQARQGEKLGAVEDFFVDVNRGFIAFAAVKLDKDQADKGDRLVAVPWPVVNFNRDDRALVLTIEPNRLRDAPAIERKRLEERQRRLHSARVHAL
ncbi:MAG: PRC-barrel domain-containing protein [Phycisphaerales bacterium]|nr:PRC-barrel domain-containing protein [Phycisphaerales bacterium]